MANLLRLGAVALVLAFQSTVCWGASGNPIVAENQHTGSSDWWLNKPGDDSSQQIKGYASALSINHGQSIDFHISVWPAQSYTIAIYRLGYYGGTGGRLMTTIGPLAGAPQTTCPVDAVTGMIACAWPVSTTLAVPSSWVTGIYLAKLTNNSGFQNYITFTVRDDDRNPDLIFQSSVTTYHAYNNYPNDGLTGKSCYPHNSFGANTIKGSPEAVKLSFDRPYSDDGSGQVLNWEQDLLSFLEKEGYDVSYTTDIDTHAHPERLLTAKGFLSTGHDEYWSGVMRDGVEAARNAGVNLAFFGANPAYWQIRMEPSAGGVANRVMVIYKQNNLDPEPDPLKKTVQFRNIGRPEQRLVGVQYLDWNEWNKNTGYVVQNTSHWLYNGSNLSVGTVVSGIIGYEIDARFPDNLMPDSVSFTVLGSSPYTGLVYGSVIAETSIYETQLGSHVFASGTMSWSWALNKSGLVNPGIQKMTRNLLDRFAGPAPTPTAPAVTNPGTRNSRVGDVLTFQIAANDPQGDTMTYSAEGLPAGLTISPGGGLISGTVDASAIGTHAVSVHVSDGTKTSTINFYWIITAAPELADCGAPSYDPKTDAYLYLWKDCGSDDWHLVLSGGPVWDTYTGSIESSTGFVSVTPVDYEPRPGGPDSIDTSDSSKIVFTFDDGLGIDELVFIPQAATQLCFKKTSSYTNTPVRVGHSATVVVPPFNPTTRQSCSQANTAPLVTNPGPQSSILGNVVSLQLIASDGQNNPLNYFADGLPEGLSIGAATGLISGSVAGSAGAYNVSVHVNDGSLITTVNFNWTVNPPNTTPQVTNPGAQTSTEGDAVSLQVAASDTESNPLTYTADGLPGGLSIGSTTGLISGTVAAGSAGVHNVSVHVNDGLLTTTVIFDWTVNVNTAPSVFTPGDQVSTAGDAISLGIVASDGGGNPLGYSADNLPPGLTINAATGLISGTVGGASVTPYSVSVHVSDGSLSSTVNFSWTVNSAIQADGDVNEDGVVDVADLLLAQRALLGWVTLTENQVLHADVAPLQSGIPAPDGMFTLGDVLVIERKVLGLISF